MVEPVNAVAGPRAAMVELQPQAPIEVTLLPSAPVLRTHSATGATQTAQVAGDPTGDGVRRAASAIGDVGDRLFGKQSEGPAAMLADVERAALTSITPRDYMRATLVATDLSMHVSMSMMRFQLSTSLGSAATGLFNTLLKNRE